MRLLALALAGMLALFPALSGCTDDPVDRDEDAPTLAELAAESLAALAEEWSRLDADAFGELTGQPAAARAGLSELVEALGLVGARVQPVGKVTCQQGTCAQPLAVELDLAGIGTWAYATNATTTRFAADWLVEWSPALLHPELTAKTTLERIRAVPPRASLLDRSGRPLTRLRRVYRIGVVPGEAGPATYSRAAALLDVDEVALRRRARAAQPSWFVDVITLRESDYRPVRDALLAVPGISVDPGRLPLAPTSSWGRAVLGTVAPATAETLRGASSLTLDTDYVGTGGLQAAFEPRLAGTPGGRVRLVDAATGEPREVLWRRPPIPGEPVRTTLSYATQQAGERAVAGQPATTALVAVDARTGEVLADVNGGTGITTSYDVGLAGRLPPGSTFKVVAAAALIDGGLDVDEPARCPSSTVVGGKRFENYAAITLPPAASFADAIAASCNTAVVGRATRLPDDALAATAKNFGVGARWRLPLPAYPGSVPVATDVVDKAAAMIGQGRVLMSPLGMALVAGAVSSGQARTPALVPGAGGEPVGALAARTVADLRAIMRLVVTEGTATALRGLSGAVAAKTGTAEYGNRRPPPTHGWLVGYRGHLAFACVVLGDASGNADAGPVVRRFLELAPTTW